MTLLAGRFPQDLYCASVINLLFRAFDHEHNEAVEAYISTRETVIPPRPLSMAITPIPAAAAYGSEDLKALCATSRTFIKREYTHIPHRTSAPHPQLLDLMICPSQGKVATLWESSIIGLDFESER